MNYPSPTTIAPPTRPRDASNIACSETITKINFFSFSESPRKGRGFPSRHQNTWENGFVWKMRGSECPLRPPLKQTNVVICVKRLRSHAVHNDAILYILHMCQSTPCSLNMRTHAIYCCSINLARYWVCMQCTMHLAGFCSATSIKLALALLSVSGWLNAVHQPSIWLNALH